MFEPNVKYLKPDTQVSVTWNMVPKSSLCTHPKFSHLQQQNIQTRRAMMITPPSTPRVIISVWKFTADKQKETQRQSYSGSMRRQVSCQASHTCRWTEVRVVFYKRWSVSDQLKTPDWPLHSHNCIRTLQTSDAATRMESICGCLPAITLPSPQVWHTFDGSISAVKVNQYGNSRRRKCC